MKATRLYAFGSNGSGQLGVGHRDDLNAPQICLFNTSHSPTPVAEHRTSTLQNQEIRKIVAGGNHTLILTSCGSVYAAGGAVAGGLGDRNGGDKQVSVEFQAVKFPFSGDSVTDVAATWEASFLVRGGREVWACGIGNKGELGAGEANTMLLEASKIFDVSDGMDGTEILSVTGGMNHVVMVLSDGTVFGWGSCRKGQLGEEPKASGMKVQWTPARIPTSFRVVQAVLGREFTFMSGADGEYVVLGDTKYIERLSEINIHSGTRACSGWSSIYFHFRSALEFVGRNDRGQRPPTDRPLSKSMTAGSEHVIVHTVDETVIAWGWGEHGNCGAKVDGRGNVAERYNTIDIGIMEGEHVAGVGAGCATSFIWTTQDEDV